MATPVDEVNAFLQLQQQIPPQQLGPEAVVSPEQFQAEQEAAPLGTPTLTELPGLSEPVDDQEIARKQQAGVPLTQAQLDRFSQIQADPGEEVLSKLPTSLRMLLGKGAAFTAGALRREAIPGTLSAGLGLLGSLGGPGLGLAGATAGSALGTEINFALGLEKESDVSRTLALIAPGLGAGVGRVGKGLLKATPTGQALRGGVADELSKLAPDIALKSPGKAAVNLAFDNIRDFGTRINVAQFGDDLIKLQALPGKFGERVINEIRKAGPEAAAAIERIIPRGPLLTQVAVDRARFNINAGDLLEIRKAVKSAKDAAFRRKGLGKVASKRQAQELVTLSDSIDEAIEAAAAAGNPGALAIQEANLLARRQFAQEDLAKLFTSAKRTREFGKQKVREFDIGKVETQLDNARDAIAQGVDHPFADLVKTLDEFGETAEFTAALKELRRLSPRNNPQLFGQAFGFVTRAVQTGAEITGANFLAEIMLNRGMRGMLTRLVGATQGRMSLPILATVAAVGRASSGQPLDEGSQFLLKTLMEEKQFADQAEIQRNIEERSPEIGIESVALPGGGRTRAPAPAPSELTPAGPIFGPGR